MVSNKTLALFIVATIVVSLGGTILSLNKLQELSLLKKIPQKVSSTGYASSQGKVDLTVTPAASCNVDSNVSFGSGTPTGTITLSTNATAPTGFSNNCLSNVACEGLMINNTGNVNVNVTFYSNVNGTTLLGGPEGSNDDFQYMEVNGTYNSPAIEGGCVAGNRTYWSYANETENIICSNLTYVDATDLMTLEFNITVDQNTPSGTKTALITVTCAQN